MVSFAFRDGSSRYELTQTSIMTVGSESRPTVEDTVFTRAILAMAVAGAGVGTPLISVSIDSLSVRSARDTASATGRQLAAPVVVTLPISFPVPISTDDTLAILSSCDSMDSAARLLAADLSPELPVPVGPGRQWTDTTTFVICRGGIPLTLTSISSFEAYPVRQAGYGLSLDLIRRTVLTLAGTGLQGGRPVTVTGQGTSETTFVYDLGAGRLHESAGQSVLHLVFETLHQTEQVTQRSSSRLRAVGTP
jgi:hypothetical protein